MRFLALLLMLSTLLCAQQGEEEYLGESYNGRIVYIDECTYLFLEGEDKPKRGVSVGYGHCDHYTDSHLELFERSYTLLGGGTLYSRHIFRDGIYLAALLGAEYAEVDAIFSSAEGSRFSLKPMLQLGYQWQFRRGFSLALGGMAQVRIPLWHDDNIAPADNSAASVQLRKTLIEPTYTFKPTLFVGWRF